MGYTLCPCLLHRSERFTVLCCDAFGCLADQSGQVEKDLERLSQMILAQYTTIEPGLDMMGLINAVVESLGPAMTVMVGGSFSLAVIYAGLRWLGYIGG